MAEDAIALLEADHQRVDALFRELLASHTDPSTKLDMAQVICMELTLHAALEEELFYPAFADASGDQQLAGHASDEHQRVKELIAQIPGAQNIDAVLALMQMSVHTHVEEERREIFPKAQSCGMDLAALGEQLERRRRELIASLQQEA